jgi:predicted XRE-type DNA-binding protein
MANAIRTAWARGAISQRQVELDLGIHQSQFSKLVNGQFKEARGHAVRLFEYSIRKRAPLHVRVGADGDFAALRASLTQRLMRAWDGTEEGARALEAILDGATRLRAPRSRGA